jgi:threonine aldolase
MQRGHGVHFPKIRALSLTQSTELGTLYSVDEIRALTAFAHSRGLAVHVDGARFANAAATLRDRNISPADATWRAGVDVLCFGGTKNGLLTTEAVVFFNRELAREFEYRVKQSGQLSSKMRFASAQWAAVMRDGAWLRHGAHANAQAKSLADGLRELGFPILMPTEANGVFVEMPPRVVVALEAHGWRFYKFIGEHGYRLMCSWRRAMKTSRHFWPMHAGPRVALDRCRGAHLRGFVTTKSPRLAPRAEFEKVFVADCAARWGQTYFFAGSAGADGRRRAP